MKNNTHSTSQLEELNESSPNLPLSWTNSSEKIQVESITLNPFAAIWFALRNIPASNFTDFIKDTVTKTSQRTIIRGCDESTAKFLGRMGFETIPTAKESVFTRDGDHFRKKSVRGLIKRGGKFGKVREYDYSDEKKREFEEFKKMTKHAGEPQLKYLYQTGFNYNMKLFTLETPYSEWLGAITVSQNSVSKKQAESMLKRIDAPNGTMELLIYQIAQSIFDSGTEEFSLGEVPFILNKSETSNFTKAGLLNMAGISTKLGYNYEGLYFFKNKFSPVWRNIYLCAYPKICFRDLFVMAIKSTLVKLLVYKV